MNKIELIEREQMRMDLPNFIPGDTVKVHVKIKEGEKERIQAFQGVVIAKQQGRHQRHLHGAQGLLRRRGRAHLPDALPGDRPG